MRLRPLIFVFSALTGVGCAWGADTPSSPPTPVRAPAAAAAAGTASTGPNFDAFRIVGDRNIFNPNRTGRSTRVQVEEAPRMDTISLVGTLQSATGVYAFFDSTDTSFRKALHEGGAIAQYTVKRISADGVELERDGKVTSLRIGQQLRRPKDGDWTIVGADIAQASRAAERAASAASEAGAPPAIPSDASDTLRRLMEQRQKQLKQ